MKMQPEMGQPTVPIPQFTVPFFPGIGRFSEMGLEVDSGSSVGKWRIFWVWDDSKMTFDVAILPWGSRRVLQDGEHPKVRSIGRCALSAPMLR